MHVAIAGASGMIGTALGERLAAAGHQVTRLRRPQSRSKAGPLWDPATGYVQDGALDGVDALVNVAGTSIGDGRWTAKRKRELRASRIDATRVLVQHMATMTQPPKVFLTASAVGFYGDRGDEVLTEASPRGTGFLADLVADWEREAEGAAAFGVRVVHPRFAMILDKKDSALPRLLLPIRLGVGGPLGSGRQWMPWVTLTDVTRALEFMLTHEARGVFNVVAPGSGTNAELVRALARALHRPAFLPVPAFALRIALGGAADELLLASQHVVPQRLIEAGFTFVHPDLATAVPAVLGIGQPATTAYV